jgi:hypothetical protein
VVGLVLIAGWVVIPIGVGGMAVITLIVMVYQRLARRAEAREFRRTELWFYGYSSLEDVADRLATGLALEALEVDGENVWEWVVLRSRRGTLRLNVSRRYDWRGDDRAPCLVRITGSESRESGGVAAIVGPRMAAALSTDVFPGRIVLRGNDFECIEQGCYRAV